LNKSATNSNKYGSTWNPLNPINGWWAVAVCFSISTALVGFSTYTFALFGDEMSAEFGWTRTQINASLSFLAIGQILGPLFGRIIDSKGPRIIVALCVSLTALSYIMRPMMTELWHWYALSFLQYAGFSATMTPVGRIVGLWFPNTRGRVMGIAMMGNNFGGVVMPGIIGAVIALGGWQSGYYLQGLLTSLVAVAVLLALREPKMGLLTLKVPSNLSSTSSEPAQLPGMSISEAARSKTLYIFLVGATPFASLLPQLISHYVNEGVNSTTAATAMSILALAGMSGKLVFGILGEKITARYAMMVSFFGLSVALLLSVNPTVPGIIWVCSPLWGLCMGAFGTLTNMIVQDYFGLKSFASIMGVAGYGTAVSFAVGPLLAGLSYDNLDSYRPIFYGTVIVMAIGILALNAMGTPERNFMSKN
jgi:MFS family permease